eukprot:5360592-Pleurochrysis_carterae.AAC.1
MQALAWPHARAWCVRACARVIGAPACVEQAASFESAVLLRCLHNNLDALRARIGTHARRTSRLFCKQASAVVFTLARRQKRRKRCACANRSTCKPLTKHKKLQIAVAPAASPPE